MRISASLFLLTLGLMAQTASSQNIKLPPMMHLDDNDTFRVARVTASEQEQVFQEIEAITSDTPSSWEKELRARRVTVGMNQEALVLQGTELLCGGTGNCQTFVLRHEADKWLSMFQESAPIAATFGFGPDSNKGVKDFAVSANTSAESETIAIYKWDGKYYRASQCYERNKGETKPVSCK